MSKEGYKRQIEKRPVLGSEVTHVVHVVLSKDGAAANGTVRGSTYLRAPVRGYARLAGLLSHTEVNDAHLVAAHSYLTAPVTLPPPLRTCCVRVRDCTSARVCRTWLYARSHVLHSSVTLPPREDMCRSLSQVHCQQL